MSDDVIRKGDLVMVVRVCCPKKEIGLGRIFRVDRVEPAFDHGYKCCGPFSGNKSGEPLARGNVGFGSGYHPCAWLKRIDPPAIEDETALDDRIPDKDLPMVNR